LLSYLLNYILAGLVLAIVQSNLNKQSSHTGFIFMIGSGIKFLIFFLVFYPTYQEDAMMQTAEFTAFFTPYAVCLTLEVIYLSKLLNNQTYSEDNLD
jgi:F0F1-type ATP synthase assembly protein I